MSAYLLANVRGRVLSRILSGVESLMIFSQLFKKVDKMLKLSSRFLFKLIDSRSPRKVGEEKRTNGKTRKRSRVTFEETYI